MEFEVLLDVGVHISFSAFSLHDLMVLVVVPAL